MKKILIVLGIIILCTACGKIKEEKIKKKEKKVEKKEEEKKTFEYIDLNNTPIAFYSIKGNTLTKLTTIRNTVKSFDDVGIFQIYPSNEDTIILNDTFGGSFHSKWIELNPNNNNKIGFNIKFNTNDETISYNILSPDNTFDKWEYIMNYLYDDYANLGKGFYSHLESNEVNENTLFTSFKMQVNDRFPEIVSPIELTVFTYDSLDDFKDNIYQGNSKYTLNICINNIC